MYIANNKIVHTRSLRSQASSKNKIKQNMKKRGGGEERKKKEKWKESHVHVSFVSFFIASVYCVCVLRVAGKPGIRGYI